MFVECLYPQNYFDNTLKYFDAQNQKADSFYFKSSEKLANTTLKGVLAPTAALPSSGLTLKPNPNRLCLTKKHQLLPKFANDNKFLSNAKNDEKKVVHLITPKISKTNIENLQAFEKNPINISSVKNPCASLKNCETVSNESLSVLLENKNFNFESSIENKYDISSSSLITQPLSKESSASSNILEKNQELLFSSTVSNYHVVNSKTTSVVGMRDASIYSTTVNLCKESSMPCEPEDIEKPSAFDHQPQLENLKMVSKKKSHLSVKNPESALSKSENTCVSISSSGFQAVEQSEVTNINSSYHLITLDNNNEKFNEKFKLLNLPITLKEKIKKDNTVDKENEIDYKKFSYQYYLELERMKVMIFEQQAYYQQKIDRLKKQITASDHKLSQLGLKLSNNISTNDEFNTNCIKKMKSKQNDVLNFEKINLFQSLADVTSYYQKAVLKFQSEIYHQYQTIKFLTLESDSLTEKLESQLKITNDKTIKLNSFRSFGSELDFQIFNQKETIEKINQSLAGQNHLKIFEQAIKAKSSIIDASNTSIYQLVNKMNFCLTTALTKLSSDIKLLGAISGCYPCFPEKTFCQDLTSDSQTISVNSKTIATEADFEITQKISVVEIPRKLSSVLINSDSNFFIPLNSQSVVESNQIHLDGNNESCFFPKQQLSFQFSCNNSTNNCKVDFANEENPQADPGCCKFKSPTLFDGNKNYLKQTSEIELFMEPEAEKLNELVTNLGIIFENLKVILNAFCFLQKARNEEIENLELKHKTELETLQNKKNAVIFDLETKVKLAKRNLAYFKHENLRLIEMEKGTSKIVNRGATSSL